MEKAYKFYSHLLLLVAVVEIVFIISINIHYSISYIIITAYTIILSQLIRFKLRKVKEFWAG